MHSDVMKLITRCFFNQIRKFNRLLIVINCRYYALHHLLLIKIIIIIFTHMHTHAQER